MRDEKKKRKRIRTRFIFDFKSKQKGNGGLSHHYAGIVVLFLIYSLLKDSLKVHGIENYWHVLTNQVNGVPFYQY